VLIVQASVSASLRLGFVLVKSLSLSDGCGARGPNKAKLGTPLIRNQFELLRHRFARVSLARTVQSKAPENESIKGGRQLFIGGV
jgi:hypothetical protein